MAGIADRHADMRRQKSGNTNTRRTSAPGGPECCGKISTRFPPDPGRTSARQCPDHTDQRADDQRDGPGASARAEVQARPSRSVEISFPARPGSASKATDMCDFISLKSDRLGFRQLLCFVNGPIACRSVLDQRPSDSFPECGNGKVEVLGTESGSQPLGVELA